MKCGVVLLFVLLSWVSVGQQAIDSLEQQLSKATSDEEKVTLINQLVDLYDSAPEAELYLKSMLDIGEKSGGVLKGDTYRSAYLYYLKTGQDKKALDYLKDAISWDRKNEHEELYYSYELYGKWFQKSLLLDSAIYYFQLAEEGFLKNKDYKSLVEILNREGILLKNVQSYGEALQKYYQAYDIAKQQNLPKNLASTCVNIGVVFKKQGQLEDAMEYYMKAEEIYQTEDNYIGLANVYNNIGNIHRIRDELDLALVYYKKAIKNRELGGSEKTLSYSYNNIALVYKEQAIYDSTLYYLALSEKYKIKLEEQASLSSTYLNFADTYSLLNDSVNFNKYYDLAMSYANEFEQYGIIEELKIIFSKYAANQGNYQEAYEFLVTVIQQMDTMSSKEQEVLSQVLQAQYNDKQKQELILELEASLEKQKKQAEQLRLDETNLWLMVIVLSGVFILLIIALVLVFRSFNRLKQGAKEYATINQELRETRIGAEEKEMMIKEIHHRVKNNLQVVKSLIRLQRDATGDESCEILTDFENRVSSIALVHESLHGSVDLSKVDVEDYYQKLIQDLIDVYSVNQEISCNVNVEKLSFGLDTLIPLGLLTNEIVSNALKHAFQDRSRGHVEVSIKQLNEDDYLLEIADDGVGISGDYLASNTLGLELIDTLVGQLDGTKELVVNNGTKYIIKFKNQDKIK
ncbi:histidine kinase dimerization/phosphoacceptor domain -containing protein [Parvicella tangerina]|nr:histidine kinase dimerization/phosphoacceptor domain -containing protein [Parvicella tangerina]